MGQISAFVLHINVMRLSMNFTCLLQALLGWLLFGESLNMMWWCGASLVILGVAVMWESQRDQEGGTEEHKGKKEE